MPERSEGGKTVEQQAQEFVGKRGIRGDITNNHAGLRGLLRHPKTWNEVAPLPTYEEYVKKVKFDWNPVIADAIIIASDQKLVSEYNQLVTKIHSAIGEGIKTQEQADQAAERFGELDKFLRLIFTP